MQRVLLLLLLARQPPPPLSKRLPLTSNILVLLLLAARLFHLRLPLVPCRRCRSPCPIRRERPGLLAERFLRTRVLALAARATSTTTTPEIVQMTMMMLYSNRSERLPLPLAQWCTALAAFWRKVGTSCAAPRCNTWAQLSSTQRALYARILLGAITSTSAAALNTLTLRRRLLFAKRRRARVTLALRLWRALLLLT